jgi:nucleosome assembly protein 1-like 1
MLTPLYDRRVAIINGSVQPTVEELKAGAEQSLKDDEDAKTLPDPIPDEPGSKGGIESFWLTALQNHGGISELITERDEGALKSLLDIRYSHLEQPELGFKLLFEFAENPYFENKVLEKTYYYQVKTSVDQFEGRVVLIPV